MSPTTHQIEKAVDMAVEEMNQVTFQGAPRLAVINPCRGRTDLTAAALRHIGVRLKDADWQSSTLVIHSAALAFDLALGVQRDLKQPQIRTAAESVINGFAAWGLKYASPRSGFNNDVKRLRACYGLLEEGVAPPPRTEDDPRVVDITGKPRQRNLA